MSRKSSKGTSRKWPKEQTRDAARLRDAIAHLEAGRQHDRITTETRALRDELQASGEDSTTWKRMPKEQLQLVLFQQILASVRDTSSEPVLRMMELYKVAMDRLTVEERQRLAVSVAETYGLFGNSFGRLFFPWSLTETSSAVVTSAVVAFATYFDEPGNDLTGPEAFMMLIDEGVADPERAGMYIAGLLMLGDRRNLPLLHRSWRKIDEQGKMHIAQTHTGVMFAATFEYFLQWMEDVNEGEFGLPAAGLQNLRSGASQPRVHNIERDLPVPYGSRRNPVRYLAEWTPEEFGQTMAPRLRALLEREGPEKTIPFVMQAWGIPWRPANDDEARMHEWMRTQMRQAGKAYGRPS